MKLVKWALAALILFAIVRVIAVSSGSGYQPPPPSQPAASNVNNVKEPDANLSPAQKERAKQQLRIAYGKVFDDKMLNVGLESKTAAVGPKNTTLRIEYALAGRVTARQLGSALDFDTMKELGFKKVYFTNGFEGDMHEGFTWDVK